MVFYGWDYVFVLAREKMGLIDSNSDFKDSANWRCRNGIPPHRRLQSLAGECLRNHETILKKRRGYGKP